MPVIRWRGFHSYRDYKKFTVYTCVTIVRARRLRGLMSREVNECPGQFLANVDQAPYCASLTCSNQSTTLPSSASAIAMCVIAVVGAAPCQCFSPGANQTTSPGRICSTGPPSRCARPLPAVTISVCPSGCVCQAVRALGSNVTLAPLTRAGSGALNIGSMRTVPVNHSAGPLPDGCVPFRLISIAMSSGVGYLSPAPRPIHRHNRRAGALPTAPHADSWQCVLLLHHHLHQVQNHCRRTLGIAAHRPYPFQ